MINSVIEVERLPIKQAGAWTSGELTNWMHPCHGPLPDIYCLAHSNTDHYVITIWLRPRAVISVLECPERPAGRGSILWSSSWPRDQYGRVLAKDAFTAIAGIPSSYETEEEFLADFVPHIVEDAESTPLGEAVSTSKARVAKKSKRK